MRSRAFTLLLNYSSRQRSLHIHRSSQIPHLRRGTTMATQTPSEACCRVPPIVAKDYEGKGKYIDINGMKCYHTGPTSATSAIVVVFDIFGFFPQTIQGADILAHADESHQYQVFIPDLFHGKPYLKSDFPADTEEKKKKLGEFFGGPANPPKTKEVVEQTVEALKKEFPGIQKYGSLGMCWGGKIVSLLSQKGTLFTAAAEVHPAMVDAADAKGFQIPVCMLASGDESADDVKAFEEALTVPKHVEIFSDQVHGWLAARADLENERVKEEYVRGYKTLLEFYHKYL